MACIQYPRKERGGVSLPSWEKPTIYKEPPKEVFTRKKERIEEGDITYNIRNDASRINDSVLTYARGNNPMVAVDYQNRAPQTTTMSFGSASNPYKVNASFRPPMFRLEDLEPLSRQRREWTAVQTNPGSDFVRDDKREMDHHEVAFATGAQHSYHAQQSNVSKEQGVYQENFTRKDMMNDNYVVQNILSKLKGMESVELQKMFQYEQTPHGIVLTPMSIEALAVLSGIKDYEAQHHANNTDDFTQDVFQYRTDANVSGAKNYEAHRLMSTVKNIQQELNRYSASAGVSGFKDYESQRLLDMVKNIQQDINQYSASASVSGFKDYEAQRLMDVVKNIQQDINQYSASASVSGFKDYETQRLVDVLNNIKQEVNQYSATSSMSGVKDYEAQHSLSTGKNIQQEMNYFSAGSGVKGMSKQEYVEYQKEKMKDVLLKNLKSNVSIVIQTGGVQDEHQINATVQDKINMIVNSAMGNPISLERDNGEPIKLKDYTWKFVKSATGSDTFILQAEMPELKLERKTELYAAQSSMNQNIHIPIMNNVELKTDRINTSASTNLGIKENAQNASRVEQGVVVRKAEKDTNYTDWTVQSVRPTMDRVGMLNVNMGHQGRKKNINQTFIQEMDGRFNV